MPDANLYDCSKCEVRVKSIFCELHTDEIKQLNATKHCVDYKKGDVIFKEGSYPRGLYCVYKGKVKITQIGVEGKEQIVHLVKDTDIMGYRALLSGDTYSCSAVALEKSTLCFIPKETFFSFFEKNSKVALRLVQLLSTELKLAEKKITHFAQRSVKERLAEGILLLKECYGFEKDGQTINIVITREEIANISGTTRETAIRFLSELKENKIIGLKGKKISLIKPKELLRIANLAE